MTSKTSSTATKVAKKAGAQRAGAKAAKPRKTAPQSRSRKVAKPKLLCRRQPADREGLRRCPRAGLHRSHAGLETGHRAPPRCAHRAHRPRRAQGRQMELAVLWHRGPRLVPRPPLLHEVREGGVLPRRVAASRSPGRVQGRRSRATSTSARTTSSTKLSSPLG